MHLYWCFSGNGTVNIIRSVAVHRGLVEIVDLEAFEQREYGMGLVEIVINCSVVSMSSLQINWLRHATYQC